MLESVLRNCDGKKVTPSTWQQLAQWQPNAERTAEIPFVVARVVLQDFTGVPLLADLAAMRNVAAAARPRTRRRIEPLVPVDLVVDHSVMIDHYGSKKALDLNMKLEFQRNQERYQFMKWGMDAFDTFGVVPPGFGIVHQVNLEYLARGVHNTSRSAEAVYYPDTLVGTDSHTTMINGIGVVGWGVGGIEAEAGMLGQPVYFLTPDVVGFELTGRLREGVTATDLVLTVTEILRKPQGGRQVRRVLRRRHAHAGLPDRATIANMAPEYGATMGFFPVDEKTIDYFRGTGRSKAEIEAFEAYFRAQQLFGVPRAADIDYTPGGQARPGHRGAQPGGPEAAAGPHRARPGEGHASASSSAPARPTTASTSRPSGSIRSSSTSDGLALRNGDVLIAAITSCTNTSNPGVLLAAGLLAKKAVEAGLKVKKHVKTSLAPGSRIVTEYLHEGRPAALPGDSSASTSRPTAAPPASATPAT